MILVLMLVVATVNLRETQSPLLLPCPLDTRQKEKQVLEQRNCKDEI